MIPVDIAILDDTQRLPLATWRGEATFSHGAHGAESCQVPLPLTRDQAYDLYLRLSGTLRVLITAAGAEQWEGRVEDITIGGGQATLAAFGRWRALRDVPYTALWSDSQLARWRQATSADRASRTPERFGFDTENRLVIYPKSGQSYNTSRIGTFVYEPPASGARDILAIQGLFEHQLPNATWQLRIGRIAGSLSAGTFTTVATVNGTGALGQVAFHSIWAAAGDTYLVVEVLYNSGVLTAYAGTDGDHFIRVTNLRVTSTWTNRVSTALTANRAAGASVTATVGSTTGMYVGMQLVINSGSATSEIVTVESITNATQFVATFANSYVAGNAVQGLRVTADEIARELRDVATTANPGALSTSNALIQSPGLDLLDQVYEDADMGDVLTDLAALGDTAGQRYEVGVEAGRRLFFRPRGSFARQWSVAIADLELQQTLDQLGNSVYATYQRADGFTLRTANQDSASSQRRYALVRRRAVQAQTANATLAARIAQTARDDTALITPRAKFRITRLQSAGGGLAPAWAVRPGDTITVLNLSPVYGAALDKVRTFTVADCEVSGGMLTVTPETPLPELEYQLARLETFSRAARGPFADLVP